MSRRHNPDGRRLVLNIILALLLAGLWSTPALASVEVNKSFSPINIFPGQTSTLTITLYNSTIPYTAATITSLTDILPTTVTATAVVSNTCGGTVSISPATQVALSGGTIPAATSSGAGSCSIAVTVTSNTAGTYVNTIAANGLVTSQGNNPNPAQATLTVAPVLGLTGGKSFSNGYIHVTGVSTATITLTNPNIGPLTGATFTDSLPTPLVVASPVTTGGTCGGTVTATAGASSVAYSGGTIPANGSCTVTFNVGLASGRDLIAQNASVSNTLAANAVTTNEGSKNASSFSAGITVQTGAAVSKSFSPTQVFLNGTSTLTITLRNYNLTAITGAALTDTLPAGITAVGSVTTTCAGGTTGFTPSTITLSGATVPAATSATTNSSGSCTITATVKGTAATSGSNTTNAIAAGTFSGSNVGYSGTGNVSLTVLGSPVTVTKSFSPSSIIEGQTSTLTITLANGSGLNATITSFTDDLKTLNNVSGSYYAVAASPAALTSCVGSTLAAVPGATSITLSGGTIPANGNCQIIVPILTPDLVGTKTNTIAAATGLVTSLGNNQNSATASLTSVDELTVAKTFTPSTVVPGGVSRLAITLNHNAGDTSNLTNISFTDNLTTMGAGHTVANPPVITNTCGGAVSAPVGGTTISLSGGFLGIGSTSCLVQVNIQTPTTVGSGTNNFAAKAITTDQGDTNEGSATATLTRTAAGVVTLNKAFNPVQAKGGAPVVLSITFANNNANAIALSGVSLVDNLPSGLQIFTTPSASFTGTGCTGGSITAAPGGTSVSLTGASIAANATCTLAVQVTGFVNGNRINSLAAGAVSTAQGVTNTNAPSATVTILPNVDVAKYFTPATIETGGTSVLLIRLYNTDTFDATGAAFTDTLPTNVTATAKVSNTCGGAVSISPATQVSLIGGTILANSYCDITVNVTAATAATYTNTIPVNGLTTSFGTNPDAATAVLTVVAKPTITKSFFPTSIPAGTTSNVAFTLQNPNNSTLLPGGLTNARFTDTLPSGLSVDKNQTSGGTCVQSGNNTFTTGQTSLSFTGITIPPSGSCTVTVSVTAASAGSYINSASGVTTDQTQTPGSASPNAILTVVANRPTITKSFSPNPISSSGVSALSFTLSNPNTAPITFSGTAFSDVFPTSPGAMTIANTTWSTTCGSGALLNSNGTALTIGDVGIRFNYNSTIAANSSCTVTVNVKAGVPGIYQNASTVLSSSTAGSSLLPATANLTVLADADLAVTKTVNNAAPLVGSQFTFTVTTTNNGPTPATNVTVQDSLPSGYSFVSATPSQGSYSNSTGVWTIGTLGVGTTVSMDITATVLATGTYANTASVLHSDLNDPVPGNNTATSTPTPIPVADVTTTASGPAVANAGGTVLVPISFSNAGPSVANGVTYSALLPAGLINVSCSGATCTYTSGTGAVAIAGLTGTLASGQSVNITLSYKAPVSGSVTVYSNIATSTSQGANILPDTASSTTNITADTTADVTTTITPPASANAGSTVTVPISFLDLGPASANGVTYSATLPAGLSGAVSCSGVTGITCSYDTGTGAVTISGSGMPGTLTSGQTVNITLSYTAPATGSVTVASHIATTSLQGANAAPDTASGSTSIVPVADVATTVSAPAYANVGSTSPVIVPISFTNHGPSTATGVVYAVTLTTGLSGVGCTGATCLYNSSTGAVTISGLSGSLSYGQTENITLNYTVPASGSVNVSGTITTTTSDANTGNNTATGSTIITTGNSTADVATTVNAPASANPGGVVSVALGYLNLGPSTSGTVTYTATAPGASGTITCTAAGYTCVYNSGTGALTGLPTTLNSAQKIDVTLTYTAPASGTVTVTSTIATLPVDSNSGNNTASAGTVISGVTTADVTTTVSAPATANAGSTVNVGLGFANLGPAPAAGMVYAASLAAGLTGVTCSGGATCTYDSGSGIVTISGLAATLGAGETRNIILAYTAPTTGSVAVTCTVATTTAESNTDNNTASGATTVIPIADVTTTVIAPTGANAGSTASVPITFKNNGPSLAAGVTYTVSLSLGLSGVSCSGPGISCSYNGTSGAVTVSGLPTSLTANQSVGLTVAYTAPSSGSVTVSTSVATTTAESNSGNNTATGSTTVIVPDLTLTKVHTGSFAQGQPSASYTLTAHNIGNVATVGAITVVDTLPTGLAYATAVGSGWSCHAVSQTVTCTSSDAIAAGGAGTPITLFVNVAQSASLSVTNTASVSGGGETNTGNNSASDVTVITATPDLTISKTHSGNFEQGQRNANYTITITNAGSAASSGTITVIDTLPADLTFVSASGSGWDCTGSSNQLATCTTTGSIAASGTSTIVLVVDVATHATLSIVNAVSVSGGGGYNPTKNTATDPTTVTAMPDLVVTKSHSGNFKDGGAGTYTITVGNIGTADSTGTVTVTDTLPSGLSYSSFTGTDWSCTAGTPVTCSTSAAIKVGGNSQFTLTVLVASGATTPQVNEVTVSGGGELNTSNNTASDSTAITPVAVNDGPFVVPNGMTTTGDGASILANDLGAGLSVATVTGAGSCTIGASCATTHGTVTVNTNGTFSYTPAGGYYGPDSFTYTAKDSSTPTPQYSAPATVSFTVLSPAAPPLAITDSVSTNYGVPVTAPITRNDAGGVAPMTSPDYAMTNQGVPVVIPVLANDPGYADENGKVSPLLPATLDLNPGYPGLQTTYTVTDKGTFVADPLTGLVTFTPVSGFTGDVSISYAASDNPSESGVPAVITVIVLPAPGMASPVANDDWATTVTTTPVTVAILTNDAPGRDAGGTASTLTASSVDLDPATPGQQAEFTVAGKGTFILDPVTGAVTFTAVSGFTGPVSVPYTVTDSLGQTSNPALLSVIVTASALTSGSTTLVNPATVDLDPTTPGRQTSKTVAGEGTFTLDTFTGLVTFTPVAGFHGETSIPYTVMDTASQTSYTALITVNVGSKTASALPKANGDSATTTINTQVVLPVLANDAPGLNSSGVATTLTLASVTVSGGTNGTWNVDSNGIVTYIPTHDYAGLATATYTVTDSASQTSISATLSVTVTGGTNATAMPDLATTRVNTPVSLAILDNDAPSGGARFDLTKIDLDTGTSGIQTTKTVPGVGTWSVNSVGLVTFTPVTGFTGIATLTYEFTDSAGTSASNDITVIVTPSSVTANYDNGSTAYNTPITITVASNDVAKNGATLDPATVIFTTNNGKTLTVDGQGTWQVTSTGSVTFTPLPSFAGSATPVTYQISDSLGNTATATITVTVGAPAAPVAVADSGTTPVNTTLNQTVAILANDTGTGIVLASITGSGGSTCSSFTPTCSILTSHGSAVVLYPNGTYSYTPNPNYSGTDSFTYTIRDIVGQTAGATVTLTITPLAVNDSGTTPANTILTSTAPGPGQSVSATSILTNDLGTALTLTSVNGTTCTSGCSAIATIHGTVSVNANGSYSYNPTAGYTGTDSFTYQVKDSANQTSSATVSLTVNPYSDMTSSIACVPDPATADQSVVCTVTCTNSSSAMTAATNVTCDFTGTLPSGAVKGGCPDTASSLAVGANIHSCTLSFTPLVTGTVTLTATTNADNDYNTTNNASSKSLTVNQLGNLKISKSHTGVFWRGQTGATYSIVVTNTGTVAKSNGVTVTVTDTLPTGLTATGISGTDWSCTQPSGPCTRTDVLAAGASYAPIVVTVTVATTAPLPTVTNSVNVDILNVNHDTAFDVTTITNPGLAITKVADVMNPAVNSTVLFTLTVTNYGTTDASGVTVLDRLPAGLQYVNDSSGGMKYNSTTGVWTIDSLAKGTSTSLAITATVKQAGQIVTIASITNPGLSDPDLSNNSSGLLLNAEGAQADLAVAKKVDNASPAQNSNVTFTLSVTNNGPNNATSVALTDLLPTGLNYQSSSGSGTYNSGTGVWTVGALDVGQTAELLITAKVVNTGEIVNTATITNSDQIDPDITNNSSSMVLNRSTSNPNHSLIADLAVQKTLNRATARAGDTGVVYTVVVRNNGPDSAHGVTIADVLPAGVSQVSARASQGTYSSGSWSVGTLSANAYALLDITATVTATATNTACVSAVTEFDPDSINNQDSAAVTYQNAGVSIVTKTNGTDNDALTGPKLAITTGPSNTPVTVTWSYLVANVGTTTLTSLNVTDSVAGNVCAISALAPGDSTTCTKTGTVRLGQFTNTGTVTGTDTNNQTVTASNVDHYYGVNVCDVNGDGKINITDINLIFTARDLWVGEGDPRDLDGDKLISINDARGCVLRCTKAKCAP
jgi:uncharacterized repeat protein (TIGR01451 family)